MGKVELSGVFEDEMLTLFPLRVLVFQVDSESFHVFDPCGDTAAAAASASMQLPHSDPGGEKKSPEQLGGGGLGWGVHLGPGGTHSI